MIKMPLENLSYGSKPKMYVEDEYVNYKTQCRALTFGVWMKPVKVFVSITAKR